MGHGVISNVSVPNRVANYQRRGGSVMSGYLSKDERVIVLIGLLSVCYRKAG